MESPKEGVFVSKRDNNIDSSADGLLHDIKYDVLNLTHCLMQLGDDAETRGTDAAREAVTNRKGIDDALEKVDKKINELDRKVNTIQRTLNKMIDQLRRDNTQWGVDMKAFDTNITCKIDELISKLPIVDELTSKLPIVDELTSKLRGGFIKLALAAAAMIMLLCFRAWRLRKQKRSVSLMSQ